MRPVKRFVLGLLTCLTALVAAPVLPAQTSTGQPGPHSASSDAPPTRLPPTPQVVGSHRYTDTAVHAAPSKVKVPELQKAAHLRQAAMHLKAAGKPELARRLEQEALLEEKLGRIRKLQNEVKELRQVTANDKSITLHVKIMELQIGKMRKLGFDFATADGASYDESVGSLVTFGAGGGILSALQQHDLVKVLAEPTLVTVSGRPATFQSGGEFPIVVPQSAGQVAVEYRQFGTRVDCVAEVLDSGRIRLELRPSISEIDASRSVTIGGRTIPGLRTRWLDLAGEVEDGETLVLTGSTRSKSDVGDDSGDGEETALVVTVTANLHAPVQRASKDVKPIRR